MFSSKTAVAVETFARLAAFCQTNGVQSLSVFGSYLHGDTHSGSDIDLLVEFVPGQRITLLDMVRLEEALTAMFGCKADLRTAEDLSHYFRQAILAEAQPLYSRDVL